MPRNIVVFADGTGQRGGIFFDENRSNIYKLFRATRCGPEYSVNPAAQLAFYDPGVGTEPIEGNVFLRLFRRLHNLISQATGLGLTLNMIQCYAAIIRMWRPGDRIFLFGFSRGAYTVRALGGVLTYCGVPTRMPDGTPLLRDETSTIRIAKEAVKDVYQFTSSRYRDKATPEQLMRLEQRDLLAAQFREKYGSGDGDMSNTVPYFIGVFDTIASLANPQALGMLTALLAAILMAASWILSFFAFSFLWWAGVLGGLAIVLAAIWYAGEHLKAPGPLPGYSARQTRHWTEFRMRFHDFRLSSRVPYARHAISIDENRAEFNPVRWIGDEGVDDDGVKRFEQVWFAGNHSDVGGSYSENDSRLSDTALKWMLDAATAVGLVHDQAWLSLFPDAAGPQHDEKRNGVYRHTRTRVRKIRPDAELHQSVIDRFELPEVLQYNMLKPYRPEALRDHELVKHHYTASGASGT
ncbi:MAG TPA: DUF2235 domain-containing protein [Pseudaminobacter sp.]|jgi:hypothetical protein|nr:DUF2235 domain-containing protein [Pseudaminobacter sp.]